MHYQSSLFIIRSQFFFLFISREPTNWPTNNGLLMRNVVQLYLAANNNLLIRKESTLFFLRSPLRENGWSLRFLRISLKNKLNDRMIKQLLNSVIAKYRDLSVSRRSIIYLSRSACQLQITFFVQPRPIIVNYSFREQLQRSQCTIKVVPTRCSFRQIFFLNPIRLPALQTKPVLNDPCLAWETTHISQRHPWFAREMTSEKLAQKFHTDDASLPRSGQCFWLVENPSNQNYN